MAKTTCVIQFFENPLKIYYGGQTIQGRAVIKLHKPKTVRGIYVKIEGKAHCEWTTGSGKSKQTHTGNELYFSEKSFFVGSEEGEIEVQPGTYTYTFQCNLPHALPTSIEGLHGYIRYYALVNFDRPLWRDQEFIEPFTVIKALNLNDVHGIRNPGSGSSQTTFNECCCWCCCFKSDPILINAIIPLTGYTPGEEIHVQASINNKSMDIRQFYLRIVKVINYFTHRDSSRTKIEEVVVFEKIMGAIALNQAQEMNDTIVVPPVPPTDMMTSDICKVRYVLRIIGDADVCCQEQPKLDIPITIGTYPMGYTENNLNQFNTNQMQPPIMAQPMPSAPLLPHPGGNTEFELPPTYEEAAGFTATIQGNSYKPRYLVYHRTNSGNPTNK